MSYFYKTNIDAENLVNSYFDILKKKNNEIFDGKLSVILLGSLARGEGTWIYRNDSLELLSDIEFFTVYPEGAVNLHLWDKAIADAKAEVFSKDNSILFHIDNTYISLNEMPMLERKLITLDAQNTSFTVVGEDVMGYLPKITIDNINFFDLKDIMTHRVFSSVYYGFRLKDKADEEGYRYSLAKNSLDLMTAYLANNGILLSGFENRFDALCKLDIDDEYKCYLGYCLCIKLGKPNALEYSVFEMEEMFISLSDKIYKEFKIPFANIKANFKSILRRNLGKLKRTVKYRHIALPMHYRRLSKTFRKGKNMTKRQLMDNLILNGYPTADDIRRYNDEKIQKTF